MKRYAYYPGCAMEASGANIAPSIEAVSKLLDIELKELEVELPITLKDLAVKLQEIITYNTIPGKKKGRLMGKKLLFVYLISGLILLGGCAQTASRSAFPTRAARWW